MHTWQVVYSLLTRLFLSPKLIEYTLLIGITRRTCGFSPLHNYLTTNTTGFIIWQVRCILLPSHGQWWSNFLTQRPHTKQCFVLIGCIIQHTRQYLLTDVSLTTSVSLLLNCNNFTIATVNNWRKCMHLLFLGFRHCSFLTGVKIFRQVAWVY